MVLQKETVNYWLGSQDSGYLVELSHRGHGLGDDVVDEEEQSIFWAELDALANQEVELSDGEVGWHQVLLLVQVTKTRLRGFLDDDWDTVRVLSADLVSLGTTFLEVVLLLVGPLHY